MKKMYFILMLLAMTSGLYADNLGYRIAGVEITDANKNDIIGAIKSARPDVSVSGKAYFTTLPNSTSPSAEYLVFENIYISASKNDTVLAISESQPSSTTIYFYGNNSFYGAKIGICNNSSKGLYMQGDSLYINCKSDVSGTTGIRSTIGGAINFVQMRLCYVKASYAMSGLNNNDLGNRQAQSNLNVRFSSIELRGTVNALACIKDVTFEYSDVILCGESETTSYMTSVPTLKNTAFMNGEVYMLSDNHWYFTSGTQLSGQNVRFNAKYTGSGTGVYIGENEITEGTGKSISTGVTGTYDFSGSTLTLHNINGTWRGDYPAISVLGKSITIVLDGTNTMKTCYGATMFIDQAVDFKGEGSLRLVADCLPGIDMNNNGKITFADGNPTISAEGGNYGIICRNRDTSYPITMYSRDVENAVLRAKGNIESLRAFALLDSYGIAQPEGAIWSDTHGRYLIHNEPINSEIEIRRTEWDSGIILGFEEINSFNYRNVSEFDAVKSGTVTFKPAGEVDGQELPAHLTLDNATMRCAGELLYASNSLIITLVGQNIMFLTDYEHATAGAIQTSTNADFVGISINGNGSLSINSSASGIVTQSKQSLLEIGGYGKPEILINAAKIGLLGGNPKESTLRIDKCKMVIDPIGSDFISAIRGFNQTYFEEGVTIEIPDGAKYNDANARLELNGEEVTTTVVIESVGSALPILKSDEVQVVDRTIIFPNAIGEAVVYDALGKRVANLATPGQISIENQGVYILRANGGSAKIMIQ